MQSAAVLFLEFDDQEIEQNARAGCAIIGACGLGRLTQFAGVL